MERHRKTREKDFTVEKTVLTFHTNGTNAAEIKIPLDMLVLDSGSGKRDVSTRHPGRGSTTPKSQWISIETILRAYATKPFPRHSKNGQGVRTLITEAHLYYNVTLNIVH